MKVLKILLFTIVLLIVPSCSNDSNNNLIEEKAATITEMAELGTVEYTISKIIKANDNKAFYTIGDRKILLSCKAIVKAGIDLKNFSEDDVIYNKEENSLTVKLPAPRILSLNLPAEYVKLEYVKVGIFRSNFTAEERNELLSQGEEDIRAELPELGILDDARTNARMFIESLFGNIGVEKIYVEFID